MTLFWGTMEILSISQVFNPFECWEPFALTCQLAGAGKVHFRCRDQNGNEGRVTATIEEFWKKLSLPQDYFYMLFDPQQFRRAQEIHKENGWHFPASPPRPRQ